MKINFVRCCLIFLLCLPCIESSAQVLLKENFEGASFPPAGWVVRGNAFYSNQIASNALSGTQSAQSFPNGSSAGSTRLITPAVALTEGSQYRISYWYKNSFSLSTKTLSVTYGGGNIADSQINLLHRYSPVQNTTYNEGADTFSVSRSSNYYFAFYSNDTVDYYSGDIFIDSVVIQKLGNPVCSGTPAIGTLTGPASFCVVEPVKLILSGIYTSLNYRFEWYSSPAGQNNFSLIPDANGTVLMRLQVLPMDYRCKVICNSTGSSVFSNILSVSNRVFCYCKPPGNECASYSGKITSVNFAGIFSGSACYYPGYMDYTASVNAANVIATATVPIRVGVGDNADKVGAWIDFNQNGTFDPSEFFGNVNAVSNSCTFDIQVPANAVAGLTRMRLRSRNNNYWAASDACSYVSYSETEDYAVNITVYPACTGTPSGYSVSIPDSACLNSTVNLSLLGNLNITGLSFQWQSCLQGQNDFTDIEGAVNAITPVTLTARSKFRCKITCHNSGVVIYTSADSIRTLLCYCTTEVSCSFGGIIRSVGIGTLQNYSFCSLPGQTNYRSTLPAPELNAGGIYNLSVSTGPDPTYVSAWIDFNANGIFEDSEYIAVGLADTAMVRIPVTIPISSIEGKTCMRVRSNTHNELTASQACLAFANGETEDYSVIIRSVASCAAAPANITAKAPAVACKSLPFQVYLSGDYSEPGYSYLWESSPAGENNFTFVTGGNTTALSTRLTDAMDYRCRITCNATGLFLITNSVTVQPILCYCTPNIYCNSFGTQITNVTMPGFSNPSTSCLSYGYTNYSETRPAVIDTAGTILPLSVTLSGQGCAAVWIDTDRSGTFDTEEFFLLGCGSGMITKNIFLPSNVPAGITRMRIMARGSVNATDPCLDDIYADVEDYAIDIRSAPISIFHSPSKEILYDPSISINAKILQNNVGLNNSDSLSPRLWAQKSGTNSWKSFKGMLVSGSLTNGNWQFDIKCDTLGLRRNGCDSVQYYIVAQDINNPVHIGYMPETGALHNNVAIQVTPPSATLGFRIVPRLKDTIFVKQTDCRYTSFTGVKGIFDDINKRKLEGNLCVLVESSLSENGRFELNGTDLNGYSLVIRPYSNSDYTINCTNTVLGTFRLNGAKNVTIDGSFNGGGRFLFFTNPSSFHTAFESSDIYLFNSCDNISFRNLKFDYYPYAASTSEEAAILITTGVNRNISIDNNLFDHTGSGENPPRYIYSMQGNNQAIVRGNHFNNFSWSCIEVKDSCVGWIIDSNHFTRTFTPATSVWYRPGEHVIAISGSGHNISGNFIGGSSPFCLGQSFKLGTRSFGGIAITGPSGLGPNIVERNRVDNITESSISTVQATTFTGIYIKESNDLIVRNNIVGNPTVTGGVYTIQVPANQVYGILVTGKRTGEITNNVVTSITDKRVGIGGEVSLYGIYAGSVTSGSQSADASFHVSGNQVFNLRNTQNRGEAFTNVTGTVGIKVLAGHGNSIDSNSVYSISCTQNTMAGIEYGSVSADSLSFIKRNRIFFLYNTATFYGIINGILLSGDALTDVVNNQLSLSNDAYLNSVIINGIYSDATQNNLHRVLYNSIYIGGIGTPGGESNVYCGRTAPWMLYNNIFYNERSGGNGEHLIYQFYNYQMRPAGSFPGNNYNLYILKDTSKFVYWGPTGYSAGWKHWKQETLTDSASYWSTPSLLPSAALFTNTLLANLNINTLNSLSWAVNGKALPLAAVAGDFDANNVRSVSVADGASDIGSDEFNTNTLPPILAITFNRRPGGRDTLSQNGRIVAIITWGDEGTPPLIGNARFYTGSWPKDITNGGQVSDVRLMNAWWDIPVSGGSDYSYSIELWYDSSMLGKMQNENTAVINKRTSGLSGSWQLRIPTVVDVRTKRISTGGLSSFSEFTGTDIDAGLSAPGDKTCEGGAVSFKTIYTASSFSYQWQVNDGSGFTNISNNGFYQGVSDSILVISAVAGTLSNYRYRCISMNGTNNFTSPEFKLSVFNVWTGAISADWHTAGNWQCGVVPGATTDVYIPSGAGLYPAVSRNAVCSKLIVSAGAAINVNAGIKLEVMDNR